MATILAVDDEALLLTVLSALLTSAGHTVVSATDGQSALVAIKASQPDLVISDIRMTPMNGMELLREIRKEWADLPVMMVTAFASTETAKEARELNVVGYLSKPFSNDEVLELVHRALKLPRASGSVTLRDVVQEYMHREHHHSTFDAKVALDR